MPLDKNTGLIFVDKVIGIFSDTFTDLSNYFVTSDGENLISVFFHALKKAKEADCDIEIKSILT